MKAHDVSSTFDLDRHCIILSLPRHLITRYFLTATVHDPSSRELLLHDSTSREFKQIYSRLK